MSEVETVGRRVERRRAGIEARRALVAQGLLARKSIREIAGELARLPARRRPRDCSPSTVGRDALALRGEWAKARAAAVEAATAEELARLAALEAAWWPEAVAANAAATDRVLAIQRQRLALLGLGVGSGGGERRGARLTVEAGVKSGNGGQEGERGEAGPGVKVVVEYVNDWREGS